MSLEQENNAEIEKWIPKVFISYSHSNRICEYGTNEFKQDQKQHKAKVLELAKQLIEEGVDCEM